MAEEAKKTCSKCGQECPLSWFHHSARRKQRSMTPEAVDRRAKRAAPHGDLDYYCKNCRKEALKKFWLANPDKINQYDYESYRWGSKPRLDRTERLRRAALLEDRPDADGRRVLRERRKRRPMAEATKAKISARLRGRKTATPRTFGSRLGAVTSPETRQLLREAHLGRVHTAEARGNMAAGARRRWAAYRASKNLGEK